MKNALRDFVYSAATGELNGDGIIGMVVIGGTSIVSVITSPEAIHAYWVLGVGLIGTIVFPIISFFVKRWLKKRYPEDKKRGE